MNAAAAAIHDAFMAAASATAAAVCSDRLIYLDFHSF